MDNKKTVKTNPRWCKGCGICVEFCPGKVLGLVKDRIRVLNPENCTKCGMCEMRCPDYAIWLESEEESEMSGGKEAMENE